MVVVYIKDVSGLLRTIQVAFLGATSYLSFVVVVLFGGGALDSSLIFSVFLEFKVCGLGVFFFQVTCWQSEPPGYINTSQTASHSKR